MAPSSPLDSDWGGTVRSTLDPVDTSRLKRVGVATYFGVYLLIAVGGWRTLVGATQLLPGVVRPPALSPLHVLLGLPRSLAWGLVSLSIALLTVGAVAGHRVVRARSDDPASLDDLGTSSWLGWTRPTVGRFAFPDRPWFGDEPTATADDAGDGLAVVDASLEVPNEPLSLPRATTPDASPRELSSLGVASGPGANVVDAAVLVVDEAVVTTDAEILGESDRDALGAGRTDGGSDAPDPDAPWPDEDGEDEGESDGDATAPWPEDWIPGDEL